MCSGLKISFVLEWTTMSIWICFCKDVIAGNWHLVNTAQFQEICNGTAIKWCESLLQWWQQPTSYNGISLHLQVTQGITWILALTYLQFYFTAYFNTLYNSYSQLTWSDLWLIEWLWMYSLEGLICIKYPNNSLVREKCMDVFETSSKGLFFRFGFIQGVLKPWLGAKL